MHIIKIFKILTLEWITKQNKILPIQPTRLDIRNYTSVLIFNFNVSNIKANIYCFIFSKESK